MKIIAKEVVFQLPACVAVFGNFDGLHKGHQLLIEAALDQGEALNLPVALFTFYPSPNALFSKNKNEKLVMLPMEKRYVAAQLGIAYYIEYPFSLKTARMLPEEFIAKVIHKQLQAQHIIVGEDFRFGDKRKGDVALLEALASTYNYKVTGYKKLCENKRPLSSTWLKELIQQGAMHHFERLTGRYFLVMGIVAHGRAIGRTIGFPTANIYTHKDKLLPPNGVYVSYTSVHGKKYKSITNIGKQPDSTTNNMVVETHILDFNTFIYDEEIQIELIHFLRFEKKLDSLEHLKTLIIDDLKTLKAWFEINK